MGFGSVHTRSRHVPGVPWQVSPYSRSAGESQSDEGEREEVALQEGGIVDSDEVLHVAVKTW